jgi:hypothetical protein
MLDVARCPEVKCSCVIAPVEESFKSFQNDGFVLFFLRCLLADVEEAE